MKLASYMSVHEISAEAMANRIGDVSASGVIKWMRDERVPRPDQQRKIFDITDGQVAPNDFVLRVDQASAAEAQP